MLEWPAPGTRSRGLLRGPCGDLEAEIATPAGDCKGAALVCHPHPQFSGSMDNKVVHTLMRHCVDAGLASLRFNFRGVGQSEGSYGEGLGELEDAQALLDWLKAQRQYSVLISGFSFGAAVAQRLACANEAAGLITVAMPTGYFTEGVASPDCDWLAVYGSGDDVIDAEASMADLQALATPPQLEVLHDAGHFFHGRLTELGERVAPFCSQVFS